MPRLDIVTRGSDRRGAVQHRQPRAVVPRLAVLQERQLAPVLGKLAPKHVVGRGLDAYHVEPGLQALPLDQTGQRSAVVVEPDAQPPAPSAGLISAADAPPSAPATTSC